MYLSGAGAATTMQVRKTSAPRQPINIEVNMHSTLMYLLRDAISYRFLHEKINERFEKFT